MARTPSADAAGKVGPMARRDIVATWILVVLGGINRHQTALL
jgi:hypothetical protein